MHISYVSYSGRQFSSHEHTCTAVTQCLSSPTLEISQASCRVNAAFSTASRFWRVRNPDRGADIFGFWWGSSTGPSHSETVNTRIVQATDSSILNVISPGVTCDCLWFACPSLSYILLIIYIMAYLMTGNPMGKFLLSSNSTV